MTVNAITDTKKGEQGLRLLIFILPLNGTLNRRRRPSVKTTIESRLKPRSTGSDS